MAPFNPLSPSGSAPGVYINEVQQPGPIPGVGTSVAAFVGPARAGTANAAEHITSWSKFCEKFSPEPAAGSTVRDPYLASGFMAHAVRGFFENGGASCYVVRAGSGDDPAAVSEEDYRKALDSLKRIDDVTILCAPDGTSTEVQTLLLSHCADTQDRFAILDPPANADEAAIKAHRERLSSDGGYGALYYPRIQIANPSYRRGAAEEQHTISVPPSGHIAGLYARSDATRGVHKAPANESLRGALGLEVLLTDAEQGPLNDKGINALRWFSGRGVVVWGARTLADASSIWRYVNVRRLLLFVEESIQEATRFAVFEPNDLSLWQTVKRQITEFLTRVWRSGALFGASPAEAFQVRVDAELNPRSQVANGVLVIEVKLYPVTPAEYVAFRVIQTPGGASVQEQ